MAGIELKDATSLQLYQVIRKGGRNLRNAKTLEQSNIAYEALVEAAYNLYIRALAQEKKHSGQEAARK